MIDKFAQPEEPEEYIRRAISACLNDQDLLGSVAKMDSCFKKAGFNTEAKFGLLCKAVMGHGALAQFAVYRGSTTYHELKKTVKDFGAGRKAFHSAQVDVQFRGVIPTRILARPERAASTQLESKVDALTDWFAELALLVKKNQNVVQSEPGRICSFCKEPGHGANRCSSNPNRDRRCPICGKIGHSETTCWSKGRTGTGRGSNAEARSESNAGGRTAAGAAGRPEENTSPHQHQVTIATEITVDEVVAATKRDAEGEALPKQQRTDEKQKLRVYPRLQNPQMRNECTKLGSQVRSVRNTARKAKKTRTRKAKKSGTQEHVRKYGVLPELANAPGGLTFRQLVRGDADEVNMEIRRLLTKGGQRVRAIAAHVDTRPRRLRLVPVRIYGMEAKALLDSGATPNRMSLDSFQNFLSVRNQR